jgi:hypothetical protein
MLQIYQERQTVTLRTVASAGALQRKVISKTLGDRPWLILSESLAR